MSAVVSPPFTKKYNDFVHVVYSWDLSFEEYYATLNASFEEQGQQFEYSHDQLLLVHQTVHEKGGFTMVSTKHLWKSVMEEARMACNSVTAARNDYEAFLLTYDMMHWLRDVLCEDNDMDLRFAALALLSGVSHRQQSTTMYHGPHRRNMMIPCAALLSREGAEISELSKLISLLCHSDANDAVLQDLIRFLVVVVPMIPEVSRTSFSLEASKPATRILIEYASRPTDDETMFYSLRILMSFMYGCHEDLKHPIIPLLTQGDLSAFPCVDYMSMCVYYESLILNRSQFDQQLFNAFDIVSTLRRACFLLENKCNGAARYCALFAAYIIASFPEEQSGPPSDIFVREVIPLLDALSRDQFTEDPQRKVHSAVATWRPALAQHFRDVLEWTEEWDDVTPLPRNQRRSRSLGGSNKRRKKVVLEKREDAEEDEGQLIDMEVALEEDEVDSDSQEEIVAQDEEDNQDNVEAERQLHAMESVSLLYNLETANQNQQTLARNGAASFCLGLFPDASIYSRVQLDLASKALSEASQRLQEINKSGSARQEPIQCVDCDDSPVDTMLLPCMCISLCASCSQHKTLCNLCNCPIVRTVSSSQ